jgi:hypothetical protein
MKYENLLKSGGVGLGVGGILSNLWTMMMVIVFVDGLINCRRSYDTHTHGMLFIKVKFIPTHTKK